MKRSSVIAPTRGSGEALEVFWSQRRHDMAFLPGFWAFAGGSVDDGDEEIPLSAAVAQGFPGRDSFACAARELFEELGLWVGSDGVRHVSEDGELAALRDRIVGAAGFHRAMAERGLSVDIERFWPIGRWHSPPPYGETHDTEFFAVALTSAENERFGEALADHLLGAELIRGEWTDPQAGLDAWLRGERYISPPIRLLLEGFRDGKTPRDVDVYDPTEARYELWQTTGGLYVVPLRTPTIPPATHTNAIVAGEERFVVIDPGSPYADEQKRLANLIDQMVEGGRRFEAIVLTHHHIDHIGGVSALAAAHGVEVWAHANTAALVDFPIARELGDGEVIELGVDSLECLFTPGHASDHLCFFHPRTGSVIAGDLVASRGTILVNPPDGHMGDYLSSLRRIRELGASALHPAHGWVVADADGLLTHYENHRLDREEKVFRALQALEGPGTAVDVVPEAYADSPRAVWPIAARSAEAHLIHLAELGRVKREGKKFVVVGT